jgi:hypothetical protein
MKPYRSACISLCLIVASASPVGGQIAGGASAKAKAPLPAASLSPTTVDLIEDIRLLTLLKRLALTPEQSGRLAELADTARTRLREIKEGETRRLDNARETIAAGRAALLQGEDLSDRLENRIEDAQEAAEREREAQRKTLIQMLAGHVREIFKADQETILHDMVRLPPPAVVLASGNSGAAARQSPYANFPDPRRAADDVKEMLEDMDDLRQASGTPKFEREVADFREKFTRGFDPVSLEFGHAEAQAEAFVTRVAALPAEAYARQRVSFAVHVARAEQEGKVRERQARLASDPFSWFVEKALLSERAAPVLREKALLN